MLVGASGAGRRSLALALCPNETTVVRHVMAVQYLGPFVFPPAEFLENRRFYPMLITLANECDILLFLQNARQRCTVFPPGFARIFKRKVLGIVTGAGIPGADTGLAERFLRNAGVREIHKLDTSMPAHELDALRQELSILLPDSA